MQAASAFPDLQLATFCSGPETLTSFIPSQSWPWPGAECRRGLIPRCGAVCPRDWNACPKFFRNEVATWKASRRYRADPEHGRPVYFNCFGVRDVATQQPMTPDTIFALHSMTKPITSVAAMMLIDSGKLALTDPVSNISPPSPM